MVSGAWPVRFAQPLLLSRSRPLPPARPISFRGGNNLYRYCRNNPVTRWDPLGLQDAVAPTLREGHDISEVERQIVTAPEFPPPDPSVTRELPPGLSISPGTISFGPEGVAS